MRPGNLNVNGTAQSASPRGLPKFRIPRARCCAIGIQGAIRGWITGDLHISHLGVVAVLSIARREGNFRTELVVMSGCCDWDSAGSRAV